MCGDVCGDVCVVCVCSLVLSCVRRCPTFPEGSLKFYLIRIWVRRCERGCLRVREYEGECLGFDTTQRPLARGLQKRKKGMNRRRRNIISSDNASFFAIMRTNHETQWHVYYISVCVCVCLCYRWDAPLSEIPEDMEAQWSPQGLKLTLGLDVCLVLNICGDSFSSMAWDILWLKSFKRWLKKAANI